MTIKLDENNQLLLLAKGDFDEEGFDSQLVFMLTHRVKEQEVTLNVKFKGPNNDFLSTMPPEKYANEEELKAIIASTRTKIIDHTQSIANQTGCSISIKAVEIPIGASFEVLEQALIAADMAWIGKGKTHEEAYANKEMQKALDEKFRKDKTVH